MSHSNYYREHGDPADAPKRPAKRKGKAPVIAPKKRKSPPAKAKKGRAK